RFAGRVPRLGHRDHRLRHASGRSFHRVAGAGARGRPEVVRSAPGGRRGVARAGGRGGSRLGLERSLSHRGAWGAGDLDDVSRAAWEPPAGNPEGNMVKTVTRCLLLALAGMLAFAPPAARAEDD